MHVHVHFIITVACATVIHGIHAVPLTRSLIGDYYDKFWNLGNYSAAFSDRFGFFNERRNRFAFYRNSFGDVDCSRRKSRAGSYEPGGHSGWLAC